MKVCGVREMKNVIRDTAVDTKMESVPNLHRGRGHFWVSYIKSLIRLATCAIASRTLNVRVLAVGFLVAEFLGIIEEFVDDR